MKSSAAWADATGVEGLMDVVNDHLPNGSTAVGLLQQIARQGRSRHFGDVLVLADRGHLVLFETAKPDTIFQ